MGIPNWNKVALQGLLAQMMHTEGLKFRVSIEEWARVTGRTQGYIEIDVQEALEDESLEDATMEEIMDALMEHYYEYGYEYDMEETERFSIEEYQDSDREIQGYFFTHNGYQRTPEEIQELVEEREEV
tara:strand:- start:1123 stop:1506 length:384 start_codon:yes stop_codon:yes gene_type:complete